MTALEPAPEVDPEGYVVGTPATLRSAWRRIVGGAPDAAKALIDVAKHSGNDNARVAAARTLLEMVGFNAGNEVRVQVIPPEYDQAAPSDSHLPPSQTIWARMDAIRAAETPDDDGIVEAVLVED